MRRQLLLVFAVVVLIRIPFLNQAIQGDDIYYLAGAQHAQIDPLHPNHARYAFLGDIIDMRGHPHPPLDSWVLAGLLVMLGDIYEVPYHAAFTLFSLVAALAMWSLARRFSSQPLAATLLFLAVPAFVVNGNSLESDIPFLAFWMASAALFVGAVDARSHRRLALAAIALAVAAFAAYQSVVLVPILGLYLWMKRRDWRAAWLAVLIVPAVLGAWQLWERLSTGALPATVLSGYLQTYGFQALGNKLRNAVALTTHTAWIVCPLLAVAAFGRAARLTWPVAGAATLAAAFLDPHPLFWVSFGIGVLLVLGCAARLSRRLDEDTRFLAAWVLIFFAAALALFFAGSARYLLPLAPPLVLLVARALAHRPRWLAAGFAVHLLFGLALGFVNYQHWNGYRQFASSLRGVSGQKRVWINGEWGLRFYVEADGGLPLLRGQAVQPGEIVVSSELAYPIRFTTGGGALAPLAEREIRPSLPLRLTGLGARSAYSTASLGFRPFDITNSPVDRVRAQIVVERKPTLSYLPMSAPEAANQIVGGIYDLENARWRWMGERAVLMLKRAPAAAPLEIVLHIPDQAPARTFTVSVDDVEVVHQTFAKPGSYTLVSPPVSPAAESVTVAISVDKTFSVPGDQRRLGAILVAVGFKP